MDGRRGRCPTIRGVPDAGDVHCLHCHEAIPLADINVAEGVGLCRACGRLFRLGELADGQDVAAIDPRRRVPGCEIVASPHETIVRARAFSLGQLLAILAVTLFWNGIVSVFVLANAAATIRVLGATPPEWMSALPVKGTSGTPSAAAVTVAWLFLTPFMAVGTILLLTLLHVAAGDVRVSRRGDACVAVSGVAGIGWRRRFSAPDVTRVAVGWSNSRRGASAQPVVLIEADRAIRIGSCLPAIRQEWMVAALREALGARGLATGPRR